MGELTYRAEVRPSEALGCDVVVLTHDNGVVAEIAPALGSNLYRLAVGGTELLRDDADVLRAGQWTGTLVLWPLPNRVRDKRYEFGGHAVDLGDVVRAEGNTPLIHGLVDDQPWHHDAPLASAGSASVRTWIDVAPGSPLFAHYPFPSRLSLDFTLHAAGIRVTYRVDNLGDEPMPFAFALHPYFALVDDEATEVVVPADVVMDADDELLPTGGLTAMGTSGFDLRRSTPVVDVDLDHVFTGLAPSASPRLRFPRSGLELVAAASDDFTHVVLYTRKARSDGFVCLENQTGATDAINLHRRAMASNDADLERAAHLLVVAPGRHHEGWIDYRLVVIAAPD